MKKYLVQLTWEDEKEPSASLKTAVEILDFLDMDDCYPPYQLSVYEASKQGVVLPLELHGAWHGNIFNPYFDEGKGYADLIWKTRKYINAKWFNKEAW